MNVEICKNCEYYPEWYEYARKNKDEIIFHGMKYKKIKKKSVICLCIIRYEGLDLEGYMNKQKPEDILHNPKIEPLKYFCPCYIEHIIYKANKGV